MQQNIALPGDDIDAICVRHDVMQSGLWQVIDLCFAAQIILDSMPKGAQDLASTKALRGIVTAIEVSADNAMGAA